MAKEKKPRNYLYDFQTVESVRPSINKALPLPFLIPFDLKRPKRSFPQFSQRVSTLQLPVEVFKKCSFPLLLRLLALCVWVFSSFFSPPTLWDPEPKFWSISACSDSKGPRCNFYFPSCSLWLPLPFPSLRCSYPVNQPQANCSKQLPLKTLG